MHGATWVNVAGRFDQKKGRVILGGVKQSIYAVQGALINDKRSSYYIIRGREVPENVLRVEQEEQRAKEAAAAAKQAMPQAA